MKKIHVFLTEECVGFFFAFLFVLLFSLSPGVMGTIPCSTIPMWMLFLRVMNTEPWCHSGVEWNTAATFAVKLCWLQFWLVCLLYMTMYWINLVLLWISQYLVKVSLHSIYAVSFSPPFFLFFSLEFTVLLSGKCFSTFQLVSPFSWSSLGLYNFVRGFEGLVSRILRYVITKIYRFCKISRERAFLDFWILKLSLNQFKKWYKSEAGTPAVHMCYANFNLFCDILLVWLDHFKLFWCFPPHLGLIWDKNLCSSIK